MTAPMPETMSPREKVEPFERYPALASWIERMANAGSSLSLGEWMTFVGALNAAIVQAERPTTLASSGDHAELIGVLRADRLPECSFDDGRTWELDSVGVAETFSRAADAIEALIAENAVLRERLETARIAREAHNRQYAEAERKLAEAEGLLEVIANEASPFDGAGMPLQVRIAKDLTRRIELASSFLSSKEAERG